LYCISPTLIPTPKDWENHHKITGFINIPQQKRSTHFLDKTPIELSNWLSNGEKPIYMGFGSNGIGQTEKFSKIIEDLLSKSNERILFCTGWSQFNHFPKHERLFITKYVNHETILPLCKLGIFHGGAGTLATMLRHHLPVIIISFYTDQPTWGKIIERKKLGIHIPVKSLSIKNLLLAIVKVQTTEIKNHVIEIGQKISHEKGLENTIREIETFFK
jgi:sterol 3beta-glucosyltransferase